MSSPKPLFSFIFLVLFLFLSGEVGLQQAEARSLNNLPTKLFIFGDSYVDAGNTVNTSDPIAWYEPYGITWPGKPSGRFSDGRVFSDFLAQYLELQSPVPYELRKKYPEKVKYGMNFAYGGTGVFDTNVTLPNMTVQIDYFQNMIEQKVYSPLDLSHSVVYVSVAGNDYVHFVNTHNFSEWIPGLQKLIPEVVNQTKINLKRIHSLGVRKVAVGGLHPIGCIPGILEIINSTTCIDFVNDLLAKDLHNQLLQEAVNDLNKQENTTTFFVIDHYDSFKSVLDHPRTYNIRDDPLIPCLVGSNNNGEKNYTVCDEPRRAFFWDGVHPTQAGWHAVYTKLRVMNDLELLKQ